MQTRKGCYVYFNPTCSISPSPFFISPVSKCKPACSIVRVTISIPYLKASTRVCDWTNYHFWCAAPDWLPRGVLEKTAAMVPHFRLRRVPEIRCSKDSGIRFAIHRVIPHLQLQATPAIASCSERWWMNSRIGLCTFQVPFLGCAFSIWVHFPNPLGASYVTIGILPLCYLFHSLFVLKILFKVELFQTLFNELFVCMSNCIYSIHTFSS